MKRPRCPDCKNVLFTYFIKIRRAKKQTWISILPDKKFCFDCDQEILIDQAIIKITKKTTKSQHSYEKYEKQSN